MFGSNFPVDSGLDVGLGPTGLQHAKARNFRRDVRPLGKRPKAVAPSFRVPRDQPVRHPCLIEDDRRIRKIAGQPRRIRHLRRINLQIERQAHAGQIRKAVPPPAVIHHFRVRDIAEAGIVVPRNDLPNSAKQGRCGKMRVDQPGSFCRGKIDGTDDGIGKSRSLEHAMRQPRLAHRIGGIEAAVQMDRRDDLQPRAVPQKIRRNIAFADRGCVTDDAWGAGVKPGIAVIVQIPEVVMRVDYGKASRRHA